MMGYFLPPATNQAVMVVKDSSILSAITVAELTMSGRIVVTYTVAPIEIFLIISILYWLICSGVSRIGAWLERALQPPHRRPRGAPEHRPAYDGAHG
jgi:polar amino acid transport system permease protein